MSVTAIENRFEYRKHPCVVIFRSGYRCGYVGLAKRDQFYGKRYEDIPVACHGGLTYSEDCLADFDDAETWWIGFDCAHSGDAVDTEAYVKYGGDEKMAQRLSRMGLQDGTVRAKEFVENECRKIVDQICDISYLSEVRRV